MTIQFNTDNNIKGGTALSSLTEIIERGLARHSAFITRIEVHLSDENGNKDGINDKRCVIEARIEGRKPMATTNFANTHEQSVSGALEKLTKSLNTIFEKKRNHHQD